MCTETIGDITEYKFYIANTIQYSLMLNNKLVGDGDMPGIIVMEVVVTTVKHHEGNTLLGSHNYK